MASNSDSGSEPDFKRVPLCGSEPDFKRVPLCGSEPDFKRVPQCGSELDSLCGSEPDIKRVPLCGSELDFPGEPYSVSVLKPGYCLPPHADGTFRADGTISLITGPRIILVDTGGPWDRDFLLKRLAERGLEPGDVNVVVGTHGHSDHIGNLNLFPDALLIVGYDVSEGDTYRPSGLDQGRVYCVDQHVCVVPCPGHTGQDVSVQVKGTLVGTVLISGDLFDCCTDEDTWKDLSLNPAVQAVSRQDALRSSDVIIPGHGLPFRVVRR